jgi:hypothetical protein
MPESLEASIGVNALVSAVAFSKLRPLSSGETTSTVPQTLRAKGAHPTFKEFTRQGQHLARIPTPNSPLKEAAVLVELNDIPQPLLTG